MKITFTSASIFLFFIFSTINSNSQNVGINTTGAAPDASAMLDITSTNSGILIPRMTSAQVAAIASPATGLMVYVTDLPKGFYYYNGVDWVKFITKDDNGNTPINQTNANADPSAFLHIQPDVGNNKGLLIPRLTSAQTSAIASPATGLLVYTTDMEKGFFHYNGTDWAKFVTADDNGNYAINETSSNADPSAFLQIQPDVGSNKGLLIPRLTSVQIASIAAPADGLIVYNTTTKLFYYYNSTIADWIILSSSLTSWNVTGNASTVDGTNFLGTTDNVPLNFKVNNQRAGRVDNTLSNTFFGYQAGNANTVGEKNTAIGDQALSSNINAGRNISIGKSSLSSQAYNNGGTAWNSDNVAIGNEAQYSINSTTNAEGIQNTSIGNFSLRSNVTGTNNTSIGYNAGYNNTGSSNVFIGSNAGYNETGSNKLYISNSNTATPLIYGDFTTGVVGLGVNNPFSRLDLSGDITIRDLGSTNGISFYRTTPASTKAYIGMENDTYFGIKNSSGTWFFKTDPTNSQIAINASGTAPDASAILDIRSTSRGLLVPRMTTAQQTAIASPATGLMVYNNTASEFSFYDGSNWRGFLSRKYYGSTSNLDIGYESLNSLSTGAQNTALGYRAGYTVATGSGNVFLGYQAGYNETGSNKLYIANSNTTTPLIYGDFSSGRVGIGVNNPTHAFETSDRMRVREGSNSAGVWFYQTTPAADQAFVGMQDDTHIGFYGNTGAGWGISMNTTNGQVGIGGAPDQLLSVNGDASKVGGGAWAVFSDKRLKKDITPFSDGLDIIKQINPVKFKYNGLGGNPNNGKEYVGVIAQEAQPIVPYMFTTVSKKLSPQDKENTDLLMYDSSSLTYILVNSIKEQQSIIENQDDKIEKLEKLIIEMQSEINKLKISSNLTLSK